MTRTTLRLSLCPLLISMVACGPMVPEADGPSSLSESSEALATESTGPATILFTDNNYVLCVEAGTRKLTSACTTSGESFRFVTLSSVTDSVAIRAADGRYVSLRGDDRLGLDETMIGGLQTFRRVPAAKGRIALLAPNGRFVAAEGGGGGELVANRSAAGAWESFTEAVVSSVGLRTDVRSFVCAEGGGGQPLVANRSSQGAWETFRSLSFSIGQVAFQATNGQYVAAEGGGGSNLVANRSSAGAWERFQVQNHRYGVSLRTANASYVSAEGGGGGALVANRAEAANWEIFQVSCATGSPCGGRCVNTASDSSNCGACNRTCPDLQFCSNGACVDLQCSANADCPANTVCSSGACRATASCNCAPGQACVNGECRATPNCAEPYCTLDWVVNYGHQKGVALADWDESSMVYGDSGVSLAQARWVRGFVSSLFNYAKARYGAFGPERLYVMLHGPGQGISGGTISSRFDSYSGGRNTLDVAASGWTQTDLNKDMLSHELCHIIEGSGNNIHESPAYTVWGDSKWAEICQYDLYLKTGMTADAQRVHNHFLGQTLNGKYWYRDWFYPNYQQFGGAQYLDAFFKKLARYFPRQMENNNANPIYSRRMNLGEFVHFSSAAAETNLKSRAMKAFGWTAANETEWQNARAAFPMPYGG